MAVAPAASLGLSQAELVERILEDEARLLLVQTEDEPALVEALTMAARRSGRTVYLWDENSGLSSLRESGIAVPGTRSLLEALRYMQQSQHFAIYLFQGYKAQLHGAAVTQLRQLARSRTAQARRAVLLGRETKLPALLADEATLLSDSGARTPRLRLRDGRWIT